jgi:hypothetical protein
MIATKSLIATTTRQLATVMSAGSARFDTVDRGKCRELRVNARIVDARVVVIVCARKKKHEADANSGAEWIEFGSANCHG